MESLESPIAIPDSKLTLTVNKEIKSQQHMSILVTNIPIGLADTEEKEEAEMNKTKLLKCPQNKANLHRGTHTPHCPNEPDTMILLQMYLQTIHELHAMREKAKERKEWLWQLLLQRSVVHLTPTTLVVVVPSYSPAFATST